MNIALSIEERNDERARRVTQAMHKSLNQVIRDYLEQLAAPDRVERCAKEFRQLSQQHDAKSPERWKFNRDEIYAHKIFSR